ncbi:hypothetical protein U724_05475 [Pseudomonas chlororaphis subsp. aurantiaca PB-St2]|nr:hypothetical protein U724_05475 [Pseudomonas chlororaphis subsp. aurantiaca PB-St2]
MLRSVSRIHLLKFFIGDVFQFSILDKLKQEICKVANPVIN